MLRGELRIRGVSIRGDCPYLLDNGYGGSEGQDNLQLENSGQYLIFRLACGHLDVGCFRDRTRALLELPEIDQKFVLILDF